MNPDILRSTWAEVASYGDEPVKRFYAHLFFHNPHLRDLFGTDMAGQRRKLADTLDLVVQGADNLEAVAPKLRRLGVMHRRFGVTVDMFPAVGAALLATFARYLGDRWTDEAAATWTAAFQLVSGVMIDAYQEAEDFGEPASWDVLVVNVTRIGATARIGFDPDAGYPHTGVAPVRLADLPGTWRDLPVDDHAVTVTVDGVPDEVTLSLLSAQPGDHLRLGPPVEPVDLEVTP